MKLYYDLHRLGAFAAYEFHPNSRFSEQLAKFMLDLRAEE